jgi:UDP-N-acetylmuramoyl-L-alanyl-D-glutamate--2,6-diaminopimelate ligase
LPSATASTLTIVSRCSGPTLVRTAAVGAQHRRQHGDAGGGTDPRKRAAFGRLGAEQADAFILTEGSNRGEPLEQVLAAVAAGACDAVRLIPRRREAIAAAFAAARPGDLVLIAGRGAMPRLLTDLAGNGHLFDDRTVAREELARLAPG